MPTAVIVIFLLFFAVLAFAWFYLQRAKTRDVVATDTASSSTVAPADTGTRQLRHHVQPGRSRSVVHANSRSRLTDRRILAA